MNILVKINNKDNIKDYSNFCDGFIVGLKNFSTDYYEFDIEEIEKLLSIYSNNSFFVAINKNIFNNELEALEQVLIKLDTLNIKGILFYDMSVLFLKNKLNLEVDLVWNQTHMVTNYNTCNYHYEKGVEYAYISGEITLEEIKEMTLKSKSSFLITLVSHQVMSHSKRKLITNYYTSIGMKIPSLTNVISENDKEYIIKEAPEGTTIKTGDIFNAIPYVRDFTNINISYGVVDEDFIDKDLMIDVLNIINNIKQDKDIENNIELSYKLLGDNTSFLFKETIFKVKRGE